jgi:hypothetical protein
VAVHHRDHTSNGPNGLRSQSVGKGMGGMGE